jgi:hypothetical protein
MSISVSTLENGEKMSTLKKINDGILQSLKKIRFRSIGAVMLGACAGLSMTSSVLPTVFSTIGHSDPFTVRWTLAGYASYAMMAWGAGGWAARRVGSPLAGSLIMGFVGLLSGLFLAYRELDTAITTLAAGGAAAMAYGAVGGLLIAYTLAGEKQTETPADNTGESSDNIPGKPDKGARLFRFFR